MDPNLEELLHVAGEGEVEAIIRIASSGAPPPGVRIVARFGDIATCRIHRTQIVETWADEAVVSLKAAQRFGAGEEGADDEERDADAGSPEHWSQAATRRPEGLRSTGRGVVVAVIDWGFDFAHDNFLNEDGTTRILALWDQTATGAGAPPPYGYGRVYSRADINRALATPRPYAALGYHPGKSDPRGRGTHGTHVLDIAAGNGRLGRSPCGVAPDADLLLVHASSKSGREPSNLGDSVTLLEALDWIRAMAGARPWVCNMSVGRHGGPHTGLTLVEQGMDFLLTEAPGRCIVQSAGNYYRANTHASGQLRPGETRVIRWRVAEDDRTANELEVWYPKRDTLTVSLLPPGPGRALSVRLGGRSPIKIEGREVGRFYHRASDPSNGDHHVNLFLDPAAPAGEWRLVLESADVVDGRYHVWVERDSTCLGCQSRLHEDDADPRTTTGTICNGQRTIAVGAYDARDPERRLGRFSSSGPTADGRYKPDLAAPGVRVWAARSTPVTSELPRPDLAVNSGTSMAAPHVAGCIALLFEAAKRPLAIAETRVILLGSTRKAPLRDEEAAWRTGSGYLDMVAAETAVREWIAAHPDAVEADAPEFAAVETLPEDELPFVATGTQNWWDRPAAVLAELEFPARQRQRLACLLAAALQDAEVPNDLYINGLDSFVQTLAQGDAPRMSPQDFVTFIANGRVRRELGDPSFAPEDAPNEQVRQNLLLLDERIITGIRLIAERSSGAAGVSALLEQMRQFVGAEQRNPGSIYYCYGAGQN